MKFFHFFLISCWDIGKVIDLIMHANTRIDIQEKQDKNDDTNLEIPDFSFHFFRIIGTFHGLV